MLEVGHRGGPVWPVFTASQARWPPPEDDDPGWACWDPSVPRCLLSVSDSLITEHILTLPGSVLSSLAE